MNNYVQSPWRALCGLLIIALVVGVPAVAEPPLAATQQGGTIVSWEPQIVYDNVVLRISGPAGDFVRTFGEGEVPYFDLATFEGPVDGSYSFELTFAPRLQTEVRQMLEAVRRDGGDSAAVERHLRETGELPAQPLIQSGSLRVLGGQFLTPTGEEPTAPLEPRTLGDSGLSSVSDESLRNVSAADQVILDDLIVDGSACIGIDCANGESFGFDTLRLKENNLRIKFDDTSNSASFPFVDWQLTANESSNGGLNKFSIEDVTNSRIPFTIESDAPNHALYVETGGGDIGMGTMEPVVELHIKDGDTPTVRLEQDGSSGFTAQTWDMAGNETNFFVRDVTNGSLLSFRIRPGAPESSIDIAADGDVGMGTANPDATLHVNDSTGASSDLLQLTNNSGVKIFMENTGSSTNWIIENTPSSGELLISKGGSGGAEVTIDTRDPSGASNVMTVDGDISAVAFNATSSRELKTDFADIDVQQVLAQISALPMQEWRFKTEDPEVRHVGPIAEDFKAIFGFPGDGKTISLVDANGVAFAAIQALHAQVQQKNEEIAALAGEKDALAERLARLEALVESLVDAH